MPTTTTNHSEAGRLLAHLHQQGAAVSAEGEEARHLLALRYGARLLQVIPNPYSR